MMIVGGVERAMGEGALARKADGEQMRQERFCEEALTFRAGGRGHSSSRCSLAQPKHAIDRMSPDRGRHSIYREQQTDISTSRRHILQRTVPSITNTEIRKNTKTQTQKQQTEPIIRPARTPRLDGSAASRFPLQGDRQNPPLETAPHQPVFLGFVTGSTYQNIHWTRRSTGASCPAQTPRSSIRPSAGPLRRQRCRRSTRPPRSPCLTRREGQP